MTHEAWIAYLNALSDEELEGLFVGMTVKIVKNRGRIIKVLFNAV